MITDNFTLLSDTQCQREDTTTTAGPEQGKWCWHCFGSNAGGYLGLGQPLATCSSPRPAWIITFHSVIFHHGSLQADNWASREAPRSGVLPHALRERETERGKRGRQREREWRVKQRESLHSLLKRTEEDGQKHIVRGFKKKAYGIYEAKQCAFRRSEEWICPLMHTQWDVH